MGLLEIGLAIYLLVTLPAMFMTWRELRSSGKTDFSRNATGYLACTVWPVVFPLVFLAAQRSQT